MRIPPNIMLVMFALLFTITSNAQSLICMAPDEAEADSKMVSLLLKSSSANIKSVRIINESNGASSKQELQPNKTYEIKLYLEKDENDFNIFGYGKNDKDKEVLLANEVCSVSIKRSKPVSQSVTSKLPETASQFVGSNQVKKEETKESPSPTPTPEPKSQSKHFRAVVGLEVIGASSSPSEQQPFFDLFFSTPIGSQYPWIKKGWKKHLQFSVWGNTRFSSSPVENVGSLSKFTIPTFVNNFAESQSSTKFNELVRSFEFRAGGELQIFKSNNPYGGLLPGKSSVSLILSAGAVTPLSFENNSVFYEVPKVNNGADIDPRFKELFPSVTTQKTIAFTTPERERFYRQYFAGFRIKTHYLKIDSNNIYSEDSDEREDLVPAMFDITFGQNEAITNKLKGVILRLDGSMPIPITNNILYVFGSAQMRLGKNVDKSLPSIFLKPSSSIDLSSADVFVVPANQNPLFRSNRDTFRIGVGVDLLKLFNKSNDNQIQSEADKKAKNTTEKPAKDN